MRQSKFYEERTQDEFVDDRSRVLHMLENVSVFERLTQLIYIDLSFVTWIHISLHSVLVFGYLHFAEVDSLPQLLLTDYLIVFATHRSHFVKKLYRKYFNYKCKIIFRILQTGFWGFGVLGFWV